ncbi:MAG: hypothetical protein ACOXZN_02990 [Minisyncoccales bacterium]
MKTVKTLIISAIIFFAFPVIAFGYEIGNTNTFFVDSNYSLDRNDRVEGELILSSQKAVLYVENNFWQSKSDEEKEEITKELKEVLDEFDRKIYPDVTYAFGMESYLGADGNSKITLLFHKAKAGVNGYIRNIDAYEKAAAPESNERKIIYLNTDLIDGGWLKETLAHELVHLITLNKKDLRYGVKEDVWLNEARAEYAVTLLGYNEGSETYIDSRINSFLERPYTSLTDWNGSNYNYGVVNSFVHYLVDHYGIRILSNSLDSKKVGVESIEEVLKNSGYKETFADVFTNWAIASYINDCSAGSKYCFKNEKLSKVFLVPFSNFLPFSGDNTLYTGQTLSNYSAHWQRYTGGKDTLTIKFSNPSSKIVNVPYIIKKTSGENVVKFIPLNGNQEGEIIISGVGSTVGYVTVIPVLADSDMGQESSFYSLTAQTFIRKNNNGDVDIELPFEVDKPLNQMNREELLMVIIRLIIHLLMQGKLVI